MHRIVCLANLKQIKHTRIGFKLKIASGWKETGITKAICDMLYAMPVTTQLTPY